MRSKSIEPHTKVLRNKTADDEPKYFVNTSSPLKLSEFKKYLGINIVSEMNNLPEPDADPITIVRYKASQFNNVIIDDTSLEIEGEAGGANIKWLIETLSQHVGKRATFVSLLGIRVDDLVYIYKGEVEGLLVSARGDPYGFLPYFQPIGAVKTLAEELLDKFNARYFAVQNFLQNRTYLVSEPLFHWDGKFQNQ